MAVWCFVLVPQLRCIWNPRPFLNVMGCSTSKATTPAMASSKEDETGLGANFFATVLFAKLRFGFA